MKAALFRYAFSLASLAAILLGLLSALLPASSPATAEHASHVRSINDSTAFTKDVELKIDESVRSLLSTEDDLEIVLGKYAKISDSRSFIGLYDLSTGELVYSLDVKSLAADLEQLDQSALSDKQASILSKLGTSKDEAIASIKIPRAKIYRSQVIDYA